MRTEMNMRRDYIRSDGVAFCGFEYLNMINFMTLNQLKNDLDEHGRYIVSEPFPDKHITHYFSSCCPLENCGKCSHQTTSTLTETPPSKTFSPVPSLPLKWR